MIPVPITESETIGYRQCQNIGFALRCKDHRNTLITLLTKCPSIAGNKDPLRQAMKPKKSPSGKTAMTWTSVHVKSGKQHRSDQNPHGRAGGSRQSLFEHSRETKALRKSPASHRSSMTVVSRIPLCRGRERSPTSSSDSRSLRQTCRPAKDDTSPTSGVAIAAATQPHSGH